MGWGIHVNPSLIPVNIWQKPLQYCKVISLQLIKIYGKNKQTKVMYSKKIQLYHYINTINTRKVKNNDINNKHKR